MNALKLNALKWLSPAALAAAFAVHFLTDYALGFASPLALLVVALIGWLLQHKQQLVGNLLLLLAGFALIVFPATNHAPAAYSFLALPIFVQGIFGLLHWWKA